MFNDSIIWRLHSPFFELLAWPLSNLLSWLRGVKMFSCFPTFRLHGHTATGDDQKCISCSPHIIAATIICGLQWAVHAVLVGQNGCICSSLWLLSWLGLHCLVLVFVFANISETIWVSIVCTRFGPCQYLCTEIWVSISGSYNNLGLHCPASRPRFHQNVFLFANSLSLSPAPCHRWPLPVFTVTHIVALWEPHIVQSSFSVW